LAELALQRSDLAAFAMFKRLLQDDAQALNDATISVRDNWQVRSDRQGRNPGSLCAHHPPDPARVGRPLMATLDVRGEGEALRWDLLLGAPNMKRSHFQDNQTCCGQTSSPGWLACRHT
jgi:type I restriction enzyme R subunit